MSCLQHVIILSIAILINTSHSSTITTKLNKEKEQLEIDRVPNSNKNTDVIQLNVGGETMMTTRETLTRFPKSILSIMFNGRWEQKLEKDQNGYIFLDFNPILFRYLLDQLQTLDTITFSPPAQTSLITPYKKMIRKLGLDQQLSLEKNLITFNVGGHIMRHRHKTFTQVVNSTFDIIFSSSNITKFDKNNHFFVDNNPKLFQHLVNQLRKESEKNFCLKVLPDEDKIGYERMVNDLGFCQHSFPQSNLNSKWKQNGITIAGGNDEGDQLNQLNSPSGIYVDDDNQCIYIADRENHRIVKWKYNATEGEVVADGNSQENRMNQLDWPTDVIVDKKNDSLIICDRVNRKVVRWSLQNDTNQEIIISNISCRGLTIDNNGDLYTSDYDKNEVRRWTIGDTNGKLVAGGNGEGNNLNQLNYPTYIFVDQDYSVYVSDLNNHRVMKWMKGATEGIVVAGEQGQGNSLTQLSAPFGLVVDDLGNIYVADSFNHRIMRWLKGSKEGSIIVGGNGKGIQSNQFNYPIGLSFDRQGNLYVVDYGNNRIQKFDIQLNK